MSTTTIRLPDELKSRIARAAADAGTTAHSFILEAIVEKAEMAEKRADFHSVADQRYASFLESGQSIPWAEARAYLQDKLSGKAPKRPAARKQER